MKERKRLFKKTNEGRNRTEYQLRRAQLKMRGLGDALRKIYSEDPTKDYSYEDLK